MATKNSTASRNVVQLRLINDNSSHDVVGAHEVVEVLELLLEGARKGEVTGIAFACTFKRLRYTTDVAGVCRTNLTFVIGMLATMSNQLCQLAQRLDPDGIR